MKISSILSVILDRDIRIYETKSSLVHSLIIFEYYYFSFDMAIH
jgi:hypothetical protein